MSAGSSDYEDPLDRLAAEEDWNDRLKAVEREVEREVARSRRKVRTRRGLAGARRAGNAVSRIFLGLAALVVISGWTLWAGRGPAELSAFVFVLAGWLVTLCLHEFAHALTAHRGGDDTVAGKGYLRLDLRRYGHPVLTFILPLFFLIIGGLPLPGGAVMIETHRLRSRHREALVSAAGPAVNIAAAAILLAVVSTFGPPAIWTLSQPHSAFWSALTLLAYLQVATALLNLMPVPGLDGFGILDPYLPHDVRRKANIIKPFGVIVLFLLLFIPPVRAAFTGACLWVIDVSGAPVNGTFFGYHLFQFWRN